MSAEKELPTLSFASAALWEKWLRAHHAESTGLWLRLAKKASGTSSVNYAQALEVALCYGWIDGHKRPDDATWWLQKFTPRLGKSKWSKINCAKAEALIASGKMKAAGIAAITAAKSDGRWAAAYDSPKTSAISPEFQAALDASPKAKAAFAKLDSRNRYAVLYRLQTPKKAETKARKIVEMVAMLARGDKLYP